MSEPSGCSTWLGVDAPAAPALVRAHAYGSDRSVGDGAEDLLTGRLHTAELRGGRETSAAVSGAVQEMMTADARSPPTRQAC